MTKPATIAWLRSSRRCPKSVSDPQDRDGFEKNPSGFFAERLQDATLEHDKTLLSRQVEATDAAIDKMVYELYGLTEEEINVVEINPLK